MSDETKEFVCPVCGHILYEFDYECAICFANDMDSFIAESAEGE